MIKNFNDYQIILQARKSRKFKELDDKVRTMAFALGKGDKTVDKTEYQKLVVLREQQLDAYRDNITPPSQTFDRTLYQKIDNKITKHLDVFIAKFPNTKLKNIVFSGATGTGKTYCAQLIMHALQQRGFTVTFSSTYNLIKRMKDNLYGQDNAAPADFLDCDLLIIDDLGTEPTINNGDEMLYTVINERYASNKSFLITTNLDNEQILTRYEQRLFGRIFDNNRTKVFNFNGKDLRIE